MEMGVGNITSLKDNMSPFDSAGGVAGKQAWKMGMLRLGGQWKVPDMCFIPNL